MGVRKRKEDLNDIHKNNQKKNQYLPRHRHRCIDKTQSANLSGGICCSFDIYIFFIRNVLPFGLRNTSSIFQRLMGVCKRKEDLNDIHKNKLKKTTTRKE